VSGPPRPVHVACAGYVYLSAPSSCDRPSISEYCELIRLRRPCCLGLSYLVFRSAYLSPIGDRAHVPAQERTGSPKFLLLLFSHTTL
jgi:hypothetical protein